jgi:hypothetical protein
MVTTVAFFDMSADILPWARSNGYVIAVVNRAVTVAAPVLAKKEGISCL